jgi:nitrogen regulatory protein PII
MSNPAKTAKGKLVIVVAPFELSERLAVELKSLGARGCTSMRVDGYGSHGPRHQGVLDAANVRFEIATTPAVASNILGHVTNDDRITAYCLDCEAVPADHL